MSDAEALKQQAARRRRLAEVFGEVLPEQSGDDLDGDGEDRSNDARLRDQVPPHHG